MKIVFVLMMLLPLSLSAQVVSTQERFQDLFTTAGYGTAFGAALGAAILPFQNNPEKNLRLVAIGASVGFIGGSLLGSYIVFTPGFTGGDGFSLKHQGVGTLAIGPLLDKENLSMKGIQSIIPIASF